MTEPNSPATPLGTWATLQHTPQPQWEQLAAIRDYTYTHTQPQWRDVQPSVLPAVPRTAFSAAVRAPSSPSFSSASAAAQPSGTTTRKPVWTPGVVRPAPLAAHRVCTTCHQVKQDCACTTCFVCHSSFYKNRHHCRRCWRAVCSSCWGYRHYVHMLGRPMLVCDRCSVPWALASVSKRDDRGLLWGLYALRITGEMPRMCAAPTCHTFTRRLTCAECGMPTVTTQPHHSRVVRANGVSRDALDSINVLDAVQLTRRAAEVERMPRRDMERIFRSCFQSFEEMFAFRTLTTADAAQRLLLGCVSAAVAYEYCGAPNITLSLSDIPYSRVLQVTIARERYTVLEAPGRVKFISFPGTHNWRTRWVDMRFSRVEEKVPVRLHDGIRLDGPGGRPVALYGGVRKAWSYEVHGGFAQEAVEAGLPLDELIEDVRTGGYTLVLSGHSLGGAVAQYLSLQLLHRAPDLLTGPEPRLMCVTFGAPLLGNYQLADHVRDCGWSHLFQNVVYRSDVVPRLSCTDELAWDAQTRLTGALTSVFTVAQRWLRWESASEADRCPLPQDAIVADASRQTTLETVAMLEALPAVVKSAATAGPRGIAAAIAKVFQRKSSLAPEREMVAASSSNSSFSMDPHTALEEAQLAAYMDSKIRTGRDMLEEESNGAASPRSRSVASIGESTSAAAERRDAAVEEALRVFSSHCARTPPPVGRVMASGDAPHSVRRATSVDRWSDARSLQVAAPATSADVLKDVFIPTRRVHRRFASFGRYHFIQFGAYGYVSTEDSETAFGILKHGCGEAAVLQDHSVTAYNRGLMLHLYRNLA